MASDNFFDGYIDGWQSIRPGSIPRVPRATVPEGISPYRHGFDMGRSAAKDNSIGDGVDQYRN